MALMSTWQLMRLSPGQRHRLPEFIALRSTAHSPHLVILDW